MPTQNVNLTPELEQFVKTQVASGYYNNSSEVHRAALAAMARQHEERELRLKKLRQEVQAGLEDLEAGRFSSHSSHHELDAHLDRIIDQVAAED